MECKDSWAIIALSNRSLRNVFHYTDYTDGLLLSDRLKKHLYIIRVVYTSIVKNYRHTYARA
jgi:hypothetical protein